MKRLLVAVMCCAALAAAPASVFADTLYVSTHVNADAGYYFGYLFGRTAVSEELLTIDGGTATSTIVSFKRASGTPTGDVVVSIQGNSGSAPDGTILASGTVSAGATSGSCTDFLVTFSVPVTLNPSSTYWVVLTDDTDMGIAGYYNGCGESGNGNGLVTQYYDGSWHSDGGTTNRYVLFVSSGGGGGGGGGSSLSTGSSTIPSLAGDISLGLALLIFMAVPIFLGSIWNVVKPEYV